MKIYNTIYHFYLFIYIYICLFLLFFQEGSRQGFFVLLTVLAFTLKTRLALNLHRFTCLSLTSVRIKGVYYSAQFIDILKCNI